eukprot:gb/GECH01002778.1/.p1 GENE.gb/GECH01002778.1/~~gb/GECH01002778.1/.p1  ORF type:complete len:265 (+),score=47.76 gb/GECH01002778.1/:1-795(+)
MNSFQSTSKSQGSSYSSKTLVGNWNEEVFQQEHGHDELESSDPTFSSDVVLKKIEMHKRFSPVDEQPEEGELTSGSQFWLQCEDTKGVLATDIDDKLKDNCFGVTTTQYSANLDPEARCIFSIESVLENSGSLRYGDRVRVCNRNLGEYPLYLSSELGLFTHSKVSGRQPVYLKPEADSLSNWELLFIDPALRFEYEGEILDVEAPFILKHCKTGRFLGSDKTVYRTYFGKENEVFAEMKGRIHRDHRESRTEAKSNHWKIKFS